MAPLFKNSSSNDVPSTVSFDLEEFLSYRDEWVLWRETGRYDGNGNWVVPVSFYEAIDMPERKLVVFQELDRFLEQMKKYRAAHSNPTGVE